MPEIITTPEILPVSERPIVIAPGFTWDSDKNMGGLAGSLRELGHEVVVGKYYDQKVSHSPALADFTPVSATEKLAAVWLAGIETAGLKDTPVTVVAHSYGALVYQSALEISENLGWEALVPQTDDDSREVIFLAPAGTLENETMLRIMYRYAKNLGSLAVQSRVGKAFRKQQKRFVAEPIRRLKEASRLGNDMVDYEDLNKRGIHTHLVASNADLVFPTAEYDNAPGIEHLGSYSSVADKNASHSDPLLNSYRNGHLIHNLLVSNNK